VQYSYDDNTVGVVNSTYESFNGMKVSAKIYNIDAKEKASQDATLDIGPDSSTKALDLPKVDGLSTTYFLRLQLNDSAGKLVSDNFYWLSTKLDTLDWAKKKDTVYTPQKDFADLSGLNSLPQVTLSSSVVTSSAAGRDAVTVTVKNPSSNVAFMTHLRLTRGQGGDDVVPIFWGENYFSLLPGEERRVTGTYASSVLEGKPAVLLVDGYNVVPGSLPAK
jgi:exo-1,4-beta-D-glucosaminidase